MKLPQAARRCWESGGVVSPPKGPCKPPEGPCKTPKGRCKLPNGLQEPNSNARKKKVEKRTTADTISGFHAAKIVGGGIAYASPRSEKWGWRVPPRPPPIDADASD